MESSLLAVLFQLANGSRVRDRSLPKILVNLLGLAGGRIL